MFTVCPQPDDTVVYIAGAFDLFHILITAYHYDILCRFVLIFNRCTHAGHVDFLCKCRDIGNFIIVGLHSDWVRLSLAHTT